MSEIDKQVLYGRHDGHQDKKNKLMLTAAHKALDIPEDDMIIQANKKGLGTAGAIGIAAAAGLPGILLALMMLKHDPAPAAPVPAPVNTTIEKTMGFKIKLVPPEGAKQ